MRKPFLLVLLPFMLGACSSPQGASSESASASTTEISAEASRQAANDDIKTFTAELCHRPEQLRPDKSVTGYLWGECNFPEYYLKDAELPLLVPGDELIIQHTGYYFIQETAPSNFTIQDGEFVGCEYHLGRVEKVRVSEGKIDAPEAAIAGMDYPSQAEGPADEKGVVPLTDAAEIEEGYLVYSYSEPTLARALLTYDPRA